MGTRTRNPDQTRQQLLEAAFGEIHANGYTAASVERILERSGVTKGALYHHFGSKKALALAVLDGMVRPMVVDSFLVPVLAADNPIDGLQAALKAKVGSVTQEEITCGCPLNNLAQEMSATDDDFHQHIEEIYAVQRVTIAEALARGVEAGTVRHDVQPDDVATFIVAAIAGSAGFAKSCQDVAVAHTTIRVMCEFLETLRPTE